MVWLPPPPQFEINPLDLARHIHETGADPATVVADGARSGNLKPASLDPDNPANWPRNMFFWRSNVLGASGKGHEYFLKHLVGSMHGVVGTDEDVERIDRPKDVVWHDEAPVGKLDLMRSEEHTSALQSLMRNSYAVFCLTKKKTQHT